MNGQDLKSSILQLAIQGKLVKQQEEEGTAKELLEQIMAEKEQLIKEKKIKMEKSLREIAEDEIPFEIPENWEWVRLADVSENIHYGYTASAKAVGNSKLLRITDIQNNSVDWGSVPFCDVKEKDYLTYGLKNRDIMIARTGGTIGKTYIVESLKERAVFASYLIRVVPVESIDENYLKKFMESPLYWLQLKTGSMGTGQPNVNGTTLSRLVLPLPPLQEQKRIVGKIEELMPYIEKYDNAYSKVKELNKKFPEDMQKSILQYAIQGKLVEQREEETAEELYQKIQEEKEKQIKEGKMKKMKALPEIKEDEIPFNIPESWKWVRFGDIMINRDSERIPLSVSQRESLEKIYDYYGASGVIDKVDNYIFDEKLLLIGEDGANLLTRSKPIAFIAEGKYWVNNHAHVIDCGEHVYLEYVMYYINAISLAKYVTGTAQPKMNQAKLNSIPVPLPPLNEQKRIVAKIEELLPFTKQLIKE